MTPVTPGDAPSLAGRRAPAIAAETARRLSAFVPGWRPSDLGHPADGVGSPADALVHVFARFVEALEERLDQVPGKNKLAFLDLLGVGPLMAQAARVPVVFTAMKQVGDGRAPAGTQVGATVPGRDQPLVFETEDAVAVAAADMVDVVSVWPGRDAAADHGAAVAEGRPFVLFDRPTRAEHVLYLASATHFALSGACTVSLEVHLAAPSDAALDVAWEHWDGKVWRSFTEFAAEDEAGLPFDGTQGFTRSGRIRLMAECSSSQKTTVAGQERYWIRGRLRSPLPPETGRVLPVVQRIRVRTEIDRSLPAGGEAPGTLIDGGFNDGLPLDMTKTVFPFGPAPQAGSAFYLNAAELFSRPGAQADLRVHRAAPAQEPTAGTAVVHTVAWEYWNGDEWADLAVTPTGADLTADDDIEFAVPPNSAAVEVNGTEGHWLRARVVDGGFGRAVTTEVNDTTLEWVRATPPALKLVAIGYTYESAWAAPDAALVYGDYRYRDATEDLGVVGRSFEPFVPVSDAAPTVYLGFDRPLPADRIGIYLDIVEAQPPKPGPVLVWEWWDGLAWQGVTVDDETARLSRPGVISFVCPGSGAPLDRFGRERHWLRARLRDESDPPHSTVTGVWVNAVWAAQRQSTADEVLGSGNGQSSQAFFLRNTPVLEGQVVEVRELEGGRAAVELPALERELAASGLGADDARVVHDRRTGAVAEVWVRWTEQPHLLFSAPGDRHYVLDRPAGRVVFGDGLNGRIPPAGVDNVRARHYQAGGGMAGNVGAGAVDQLLAGVLAQGVSNPRAAEGGADAELVGRIGTRGALVTRHRRQAVTADDYAALAKEASPAVAVARVLPETRANGRPAPGCVKVVVVPHSTSPRPQPSFELRRRVREFLDARVPAGVVGRVSVDGPDYLPVGARVTVAAVDPDDAGPLLRRVHDTLGRFLHPLTGGPDGEGWPFGRSVFLSDVAAVLERLQGVDYVRELVLEAQGLPQSEEVRVPPHRICVAGDIHVRVEEAG